MEELNNRLSVLEEEYKTCGNLRNKEVLTEILAVVDELGEQLGAEVKSDILEKKKLYLEKKTNNDSKKINPNTYIELLEMSLNFNKPEGGDEYITKSIAISSQRCVAKVTVLGKKEVIDRLFPCNVGMAASLVCKISLLANTPCAVILDDYGSLYPSLSSLLNDSCTYRFDKKGYVLDGKSTEMAESVRYLDNYFAMYGTDIDVDTFDCNLVFDPKVKKPSK